MLGTHRDTLQLPQREFLLSVGEEAARVEGSRGGGDKWDWGVGCEIHTINKNIHIHIRIHTTLENTCKSNNKQ